MTPVNPIGDAKPTEGCIRYQSGFEHQLTEPALHRIPDDLWKQILKKVDIREDIVTSFMTLTKDGTLISNAGFAWNGVSGPVFERATNIRGGQVHDAFCRLIRYGDLPLSVRDEADEILRRVWIEDGMWKWLANTEVKIMRTFCDSYVRPSSEPIVMTAP